MFVTEGSGTHKCVPYEQVVTFSHLTNSLNNNLSNKCLHVNDFLWGDHMEQLTTSRLVLRRFLESDRDCMIRILRNEEISKTFMLPVFDDDEAAGKLFDRIYINSQSEAHYERAICLEDQVIGFLNDVEIAEVTIELGYVIHPDYQGRGYATEALSASIQQLFRLGYSAVRAGYFEQNPASGRVMEKSGMHRVSKTEEIEYRGILHKCLYYEIKREEYQ